MMTITMGSMTPKKERPEQSAEMNAATELVRMAKEQGLALTGPNGLLKQLTKTVIETALNEEMTEHLGYEKNDPVGREVRQHSQRNPGENYPHRFSWIDRHWRAA